MDGSENISIIASSTGPKLDKPQRGAEAVLKKIGLTSSEAITLFLAQVKLRKGLPFPLRVPNKETRRAIKEARARKNVETFDSVSEWAKKTRSHWF
jgi:addiction module RelB/DinJ family antitoxin